MQRVFITGGNGMIGRDLVATLQPEHEITQLWRYTAGRGLLAPSNVVWGDLKDGDLRRLVEEAEPDIILHLGALASNHIALQYPAEAMQTNAVGTARMVEAAQHVPNLKAVIPPWRECGNNHDRDETFGLP